MKKMDYNTIQGKPKVSLCIACYNHEYFLDDFFKSFLEQTYENIELIIVDDCSTDRSVEKIHLWEPALKEKCVGFRLIQNEKNLGVSHVCNILKEEASGELIKQMASDDMFANKNAISWLVDEFLNDNQLMLCHANAYIVSEDFKFGWDVDACELYSKEKTHDEYPDKEKYFMSLFEEDDICTPTYMVRKKVYDLVGNYDDTIMNEDYIFFLKVAVQKLQFKYLHKPVVLYRRSEQALSNYNIGNRKYKVNLALEEINRCYDLFIKYVPLDKKTYYKNLYQKKKLNIIKAGGLKGLWFRFLLLGMVQGCKVDIDWKSIFKWFMSPIYKNTIKRLWG